MYRRTTVITLAALLPSLLLGYGAIGGGKGLLRVQDATVDEPGLNIGLNALGRRIIDSDTGHLNGTGYVADLSAPSIHYVPISTKYFGAEMFGSWGGIFQYATIPQSAQKYQMGWHDLRAGAKISLPVIPVLKLGAIAAYTFKYRNTNLFYLDPDAALPLNTEEPFLWAGLVNLRFQDLTSSAPNLMFNYGKAAGRTQTGAGLELAAAGFAIFAEIYSLQPDGSDGIFDTERGSIRLTPGIRFGHGSAFTLAYTFGWGPKVANSVNIGLNIATPFFRRLPPKLGTIAGTVKSASTGQALAATVTFPDNPKLPPVSTDPNTGVFILRNVPAGDLTVRVEAEGYMPTALPVHVEANTTRSYEFSLRPLVSYGVIAGSVNDATTGRPLAARVEFPGSNLPTIQSDAASGAFRVNDVPVGAYTVTVSAEGYFPSTQTVAVAENSVATPTFLLNPATVKSTVTGQVTDRGTGSAIAATLVFKDAATGNVITEVSSDPATGVYAAEVPVGTYAVTAKSEGYIDQSAAVAAERDRTARQDFALVKPGTKVTLRNIYFDFNKATIRLPQSQEALDAAAKILTDNPTIRVEIQGHTDNIGSDEYNQRLSERRAQAVVTHLVQNYGIAPNRLTAVGMGESQPVADNSTESGRALNRRVEFVVLGEVRE
ncbi:MAG: carboxypeptidase regulatory-like domain-containing protein [candidate division WOR-3 bacterium]